MKKPNLKKRTGEKKQKTARSMPKWLKPIGKVLSIIFFPLRPFGRYVKGAWQELQQVKWPSRKTSLKLTGAVVIFTGILTAFIVSLDWVFEQLVKRTLL